MVVHATPKTHPGGVQGALFNSVYQSEDTSDPVKKPPIASAPKFKIKKRINLYAMIILAWKAH